VCPSPQQLPQVGSANSSRRCPTRFPVPLTGILQLLKVTMNKSELIERMADQAGISKTAAGAALDAATEAIKATLNKGGSVTLVGFGAFTVTKRAARMGRNPRTGEPVKIKASKAPKFTAGKGFKDALN